MNNPYVDAPMERSAFLPGEKRAEYRKELAHLYYIAREFKNDKAVLEARKTLLETSKLALRANVSCVATYAILCSMFVLGMANMDAHNNVAFAAYPAMLAAGTYSFLATKKLSEKKKIYENQRNKIRYKTR